MRYVVEFGVAATGLTPVFDMILRLDNLAPILPEPTFTEIDATGSYYFDFVRLAGDPDVYFEATAGGVTVKGLMSFLDSGVDFGTMPTDITAIKARTDNLPVNTAQEISNISKRLTNALGLLHENAVLDKTTYESGTNNLLTGRIRIYDTEANATMARNQSELNNEYDTGKLAQYAIVGRYLGDNMVNYLTVKQWEAP